MNITSLSEHFEINNITVILGWTPESSLYRYNVNVVPQPEVKWFQNDSTRAQLTIAYNVLYNVSVIATHLCGQNSVTAMIELYYGEYIYIYIYIYYDIRIVHLIQTWIYSVCRIHVVHILICFSCQMWKSSSSD